MSTNGKNPPAATHFDGSTFMKVWRNFNQDKTPRYTTTVGYIYTDKESGEVRESRNLRDSDLLRLPSLAPRARQSIRRFKAEDREQGRAPQRDSRQKEFKEMRQQQGPAKGETRSPQP